MELRRLQLEHFRNYPSLDLTLGPGMHVLAGANAQGKTNLLEAVYAIATGHSPRTNQEVELIEWDAEVARAVGDFHSTQRGEFTVELSLGHKAPLADGRRSSSIQKRIKVNGAARQLVDLAGLVPVVLFLVDDLEIIRGEPARRRAFLDADLSAMSRTYAWALRQYTRVLEHRNRLLKDIRDGAASVADLMPWDVQLASFGGRLLEVRTRFVGELNEVSGGVYQGLTASAQRMSIAYRCEWAELDRVPNNREELTALLSAALVVAEADEIRRGTSLVGPHRDDLQFLVDGRDIRQFGSQGEQRTAALALRVSEFSLLHELFSEPPVLLLDDILSELDRTRRGALLEHLAPIAQVIVTTTDVDAMGLPPHADAHIYQVSHGSVAPQPSC
ncbi:MAG: DNA replication/repair protein RecF [Armatimonadota bacterium]